MIKGLLRFVIAVIFILSGFVKAVDLVGFSFKMEEYFSPTVFNMPFLEKFALLFSIIVVVLELLLGFMLLLMQLHGYIHVKNQEEFGFNSDEHAHVHIQMDAQKQNSYKHDNLE